MERLIVLNDSNIDLSILDNELSFEIPENEHNLYLYNIKDNNNLVFELKNNAILYLSLFAQNQTNDVKISANLGENSKIIVYYADFSVGKENIEASINLNKKNAYCEWHLASLSSDQNSKDIKVNIYHNSPDTFGRIDNYGVCKDEGALVFSGISHILKGCHRSKSHQTAKIVVFDNMCVAKAKPILKIDENDIEASHAASVGKVSDEHIFYLTSRGLNLEEAKMLITLGYLKPILKGFNESIQSNIDSLIERRLSNV